MEAVVQNASGANLYDVRLFGDYDFEAPLATFLNDPDTRSILNVGKHEWSTDPAVAANLAGDIMKTVVDLLPAILASVPVLLYQGQFDWKDGYAENSQWIDRLAWPGKKAFLAAPRGIWRVGKSIAGYAQGAANLTQVLVCGAGHLSPMDQPVNVHDMVYRFVNGLPFF